MSIVIKGDKSIHKEPKNFPLTDLSDVVIADPVHLEVLQYRDGFWQNEALPFVPNEIAKVSLGSGSSIALKAIGGSYPAGWVVTDAVAFGGTVNDLAITHSEGKVCTSLSLAWQDPISSKWKLVVPGVGDVETTSNKATTIYYGFLTLVGSAPSILGLVLL